MWNRNKPTANGIKGFFGRYWRRMILAVKILLLIILLDSVYVAGKWPDWGLYDKGPIFKSNFIKVYEQEREENHWPPLNWKPVPLSKISDTVVKAVIVAEDSRFYQHKGFDQVAFEEAMQYNLSRKRFIYGASTISQQTVKNLFLSSSKNPMRKWHELLITFGMELNLEKKRILELYLNIAEFGTGVFGVEAAAQYYWNTSAARLTLEQAVELAATLSAPKKHNPNTRTTYFNQRRQNLLSKLGSI